MLEKSIEFIKERIEAIKEAMVTYDSKFIADIFSKGLIAAFDKINGDNVDHNAHKASASNAETNTYAPYDPEFLPEVKHDGWTKNLAPIYEVSNSGVPMLQSIGGGSAGMNALDHHYNDGLVQ